MKYGINILFLLLLLFLTIDSASQTNESPSQLADSASGGIKYFQLSGEAGVSAELYSISSRERRRPSSSGMIFFRPTLTLFENFDVSFDILLSTEGSSTRQSINQLAIHPEWSWGKAHIGDFAHEFSLLTLSGVNIRGAGIELYPWNLRFQAVGGQIQSAINDGPYNSVFSRYIGGFKLGYGNMESSFFDLNIIRVRDNVASLPGNLFNDTTVYAQLITPQENLVLGFNTEVKLFDNMIKFTGEAAGDIYTRDMFSRDLESDKIPSIAKSIYKVNISTNLDYAYSTQVDFNYDVVNAKAGYSIINPGYTSLGISSIINDRKTINLGGGIRLLENKLTLQGSFQSQSDNLLSQKIYTTSRTNVNLTATVRPLNELNLTLGTMINSMENDASSDTFKVDNVNSTYMLNATSQFLVFKQSQVIVFSYTTQNAKDNNIFRKGSGVKVQNILFSITSTIDPSWSVSPSVMINILDMPLIRKTTTSNYNLRINNKMMSNKLSSSIVLGYTSSENIKSTVLGITSAFSITSADAVSLNLRSSFNELKNASEFNEHKANFTFTHRF